MFKTLTRVLVTKLRPVTPKGRDADAMQMSTSSDVKLNKNEDVDIMLMIFAMG